ncbi:MAG: thiamine-phosphate kinase [Thiotrichaceae bacterium]|nr:thiamine-phosphate kinase [Thiotrichaceae bacterium]
MTSEFDIISQYFSWNHKANSIHTAVGDDGAILIPPVGKQLVVTTDTLISDVHFPDNTPADAIAHKALAVNLSDLAAMGAEPEWFTLALTLPNTDPQWLEAFSQSLKKIASQYSIALIGGDTTSGSTLSITITAMGFAEPHHLLLRSTAQSGDLIYVSGLLGDAAAGLAMVQQRFSGQDNQHCIEQLNKPTPQLTIAHHLRGIASSCIDVSDGFLADLNHILKASQLGARIHLDQIPLSSTLQNIDHQEALNYALSGGDDYQLLFTIPQKHHANFKKICQQQDLLCYCVGQIDHSINGMITSQGKILNAKGFNHFLG